MPPVSAPWPTSASSAWTTTPTPRSSSPATRPPAPANSPRPKEANRVLAAAQAPVEHGFAHLKTWRILTKPRTDPARATNLLRALLVLSNLELPS
ncbi:transposase family protein [Streptomyces sp. NPDC048156]|uniref:transposase family protein n=1 Tax=Streptomyces sp. NPDC048156 TaxID=3365502 RepID=UPI0037230E8A